MADVGRLLILIGLVIAAVGFLLVVSGAVPWLGRLPGDLAYEGKRFRFYFPLATSLVVSVLFSLLLYLFRR